LDHADAVEILGLQAAQIESSDRIRRWLTAPQAAPSDSLSVALLHVLTDNRTMFPRKSSWTTMVSEAQLAVLGDPQLFLVAHHAALRTFANQMLQVQRQSEGYSELLTAWKGELEEVMAQVDSFFDLYGGGA